MPADPAEAIALFRYRVVAEATNERLSPAERGLVVRELAAQMHELPDGSRKELSRATLDRWIRACRAEGLDGLRPAPRSDIGTARVAPELIEEACALHRVTCGRHRCIVRQDRRSARPLIGGATRGGREHLATPGRGRLRGSRACAFFMSSAHHAGLPRTRGGCPASCWKPCRSRTRISP